MAKQLFSFFFFFFLLVGNFLEHMDAVMVVTKQLE